MTIPLSNEELTKLRNWAAQTGLTPDEFLRLRLKQLLEGPDDAFRQAAAYVLKKNSDLYKRLA